MRLLLSIGMVAAFAMAPSATEKVTVTQLENLVAQASTNTPQSKRQTQSADEVSEITDSDLLLDSDDSLVRRLANIELTERMSTPTLYLFVGKYRLGPQAQMALELIADRSSLLGLPSGEKLALPPPDAKTQTAMFTAARQYVVQRLSRLPNFVATRTTTTFNNTPASLKYFQSMSDGSGFRRAGTEQRLITFQDGKEVMETAVAADAATKPGSAFESRGEFGAQAAVVAMDTEHGTVKFDHWENTMDGVAAVYQFSVPRGSSHYEVTDNCKGRTSFHDTPGYNGEIALSAKTGAILRIMLEAESKHGDPVSHVASVIEYGPVVIGNRRYLCPLRSLAFLTQDVDACSHGRRLQPPVMMINRTIFSNYHRFGSRSTLIFDEADGEDTASGAPRGKPEAGKDRKSAVEPAASVQSNNH